MSGFLLAEAPDRHSAVGLEANYHVLSEKTSVAQALGFPLIVREKANILEVALHFSLLIVPSAKVSPYVKFGFGMDHVNPDATIATQYGSGRVTDSHLWLGLLGGSGSYAGTEWSRARAAAKTISRLLDGDICGF